MEAARYVGRGIQRENADICDSGAKVTLAEKSELPLQEIVVRQRVNEVQQAYPTGQLNGPRMSRMRLLRHAGIAYSEINWECRIPGQGRSPLLAVTAVGTVRQEQHGPGTGRRSALFAPGQVRQSCLR